MKRYFSLSQWLLTVSAIFTMILLAHLKRYEEWHNKLDELWLDFEDKKDKCSVDDRLENYGYVYDVCKLIKKQVDTGDHKSVIAFPPKEYFIKNNINFTPPEPAIFYYYTGIKSVWPMNPAASKATHWIEVSNTQLKITRITSPVVYEDLIKPYKNSPL